MKAVAAVLPFRVNDYVIEELIDWSNIPDDPIFQLTFPQPEMLSRQELNRMFNLIRVEAPEAELTVAARAIQQTLNPQPAGQQELNVPCLPDGPLEGVQHKYRETVLYFPAASQTCHAYCTYCFRWAQFVGLDELKFASRQADRLVAYLKVHPEVTSVLITGGDSMVMKTQVLRRYVEPLLDPALEHIESIRFGTKATAYWPYRFVTDPDADDLLRLFAQIRAAGKHVALMAHYSHPRELETPIAQAALRRIRDCGTTIRCQAPVVRHVNDSGPVWAELLRKQVRSGAVPYYMFVERDTGPRNYFEVPLVRALEIFNEAYRDVSGLSRSIRGPSMSATPGKVVVDGVTTINGEEVFVLKFLQARNPEWVGRLLFAKFNPQATWLDDLEPAFGEEEFFFSEGLRAMQAESLRSMGRS
jgi:KamA family protein